MEDKKLSEVLDTAIKREEEAYDFYMGIYEKTDDRSVKDTVQWIATEEKKHKAFLVSYREGRKGPDVLKMHQTVNYKIAEHQQEPPIEAGMDSAEVFMVASHRELKSYKFYTDLAQIHPEGELRTILLKMASEELRHKEKMEYLYSNTAFPQTSGG